MRQSRLLSAPLGICLLLLLLLTPQAGIAAELPLGWPHGWSQARQLLAGDRLSGYSSVALSNGDLMVARVMPGHQEPRLVVDRIELNGDKATTILDVGISGLREFLLLKDNEGVYLATLSRQDNASSNSLRFALLAIPSLPDEKSNVIVSFAQVGTASDMVVTTDGNGRFVWAWSGSEAGLRQICVFAHDREGNTLLRHNVTASQAACLAPILAAVGDGNIFLMYYRDNSMYSELIYQGITLDGGLLPENMMLGRASPDAPRPVILTAEPGSAVILWAQSVRGSGRRQSGVLYYGKLMHHGEWQIPLRTVVERPASILQVDAIMMNGNIEAIWLEDKTGSLQLEYGQLDTRGVLTASGPVTQGSRHRFAPRLHPSGQDKVVLFAEYSADQFVLYGVDDRKPAQAPLSYWLGLDTSSPLGDALFRYVTLLGSSLGLASLAVLPILFGVLLITFLDGFFPRPEGVDASRLFLLFALLALFKRNGGLLYYGAVFVPGLSGVFIVAGSALFSLMAMKVFSRDMHETMEFAVAGYLFVVADYFCSLYVGGLGI